MLKEPRNAKEPTGPDERIGPDEPAAPSQVRNPDGPTEARAAPAPGVPDSADIVIVGGGLAGLALAAELEQRSALRPVLLESGPDSGREHYRWTLDRATANSQWLTPESDRHAWRPYSTTDGSFTGIACLRRRLGGRSLYWHGSVLPIEPWALTAADWPQDVVRDLVDTWDDGPSLYGRVRERLAAWSSEGAVDPSETPVVRIGDRAFRRTPQAVRSAGRGGRWRAYSPLEHLTDDTRLYCDCHVLGVLTRGGETVGVRVRQHGEVREIRAPRVVLAAGTVESSRLAIQALVAEGVLTEPELPGLVDKVAHGFVASLASEETPAGLLAAAERGSFLMSSCGESLRSTMFLRTCVNRHGVVVADAYLMGEQRRGTWGTVRCEPDGDWPWPTHVTCGPGPEDERLAEAQKDALALLWCQLSEAAGRGRSKLSFAPGLGSPDLPHRLTLAEELPEPVTPHTYSFPLGSEQHEAGTLPLGEILDDRHQVRGVPGLFVAGPASFPRTGAANPVLTTLALAVRLADRLSTSD